MRRMVAEQLLADAQRLVARSQEHEQSLSRLVSSLEDDGDLPLWSSQSLGAGTAALHLETAATRTTIPSSADLLTVVRHLCVAAREQHARTETFVARMLGDVVVRAPYRVRVLVVDDSDDNRELAETVLEAAGFDVITARNGLEGVVAAHCEHPAIVLMDVTMPILDGIEAARLPKASAGTRHVNVSHHNDTRGNGATMVMQETSTSRGGEAARPGRGRQRARSGRACIAGSRARRVVWLLGLDSHMLARTRSVRSGLN